MHLVSLETAGSYLGSDEAVDLEIPPGDILILSSADTDLLLLSKAAASMRQHHGLSVRLANYMALSHPYAVDLFIQKTASFAKMIVLRLLGGKSYWPYGVEQLQQVASDHGILLLVLSGEGKDDEELASLSSVSASCLARANGYLKSGGHANAHAFYDYLADILLQTDNAPHPQPFLPAGLYWPDKKEADLASVCADHVAGQSVVAIVFYRALMAAGDLDVIDALIKQAQAKGLNPVPIYVSSLKDAASADITSHILRSISVDVILNLTSFAVSDPNASQIRDVSHVSPGPFGVCDAPVLQVVTATMRLAEWQDSLAGLSPRDLAMHVALPELDGRVLTRAVGVKSEPMRDPESYAYHVRSTPLFDRIDYVMALTGKWAKLRHKPAEEKTIALILANYPNRDGRIANGVGLDTPQSVFEALGDLAKAGYDCGGLPDSSASLIEALKAGPTNEGWQGRRLTISLDKQAYEAGFAKLPQEVQQAVIERWGPVADDPQFDGTQFHLGLLCFGRIFVGIQPARGYQIDPKATYHAPDLVPPHYYFAFYLYLREVACVDALVHFGKHGNLEWLPGKALALSSACYPEAVMGPLPHIYPFIVNDPGEGAQAKRRSQAVILDHLTPPMMLADSHGVTGQMEALMDEYFEAAGMDGARSTQLMTEILTTAEAAGILADCGIDEADSDPEKLMKLDNFLCDIKELQIRDGLHIFGRSADTTSQQGLIAAILRTPRGEGIGKDQSLMRAIAQDLSLGAFDPLTATRGEDYTGPKPEPLKDVCSDAWRHQGDTAERIALLAGLMITGERAPCGPASALVIEEALPEIAKGISDCAASETNALMRSLDGRFIAPGPSGAPTRGRPEILPTGRNFYSLDSRALPTPTAWKVGKASAEVLLQRYVMEEGEWPKAMTISAWGTANMRTGGDDIAQMLALMGVKPKWDSYSRRVTGFDIISLAELGRPRVDVTLRCSGFFRDAFPAQMALLDKAAIALANLQEPDDQNPIAAHIKARLSDLESEGVEATTAARLASLRVFSSKPGAYGAGLQALIDEGIWRERSDFAESYLQWSSYGYGEKADGIEAKGDFEARLSQANAIIHNQDNREHDLLDSDDYYQFIGGLSASVASLKGEDVPIYFNDHSLAEAPVARRLDEEIARVVRGRASNPKWIQSVMRHGYKGAFEMAATVDYLFAFSATTGQVREAHFNALFEAYIEDDKVRDFLKDVNEDAYYDMIRRFEEAIARGLWVPRRNAVHMALEQMTNKS
ncbi:MAG: cobaltochelatase subunit CobN [Candidatus Puniceispirillaceae bacterium]